MEHDDRADGRHGNQRDHKDHDKHRGGQAQDDAGGLPPQAFGEDLVPTDLPTGTTVMVSLGLAILLGAIGGWVLRVSTPS